MRDENYVQDILDFFANRDDPRLQDLIQLIEQACDEGKSQDAVTIWIPQLLEIDRSSTLNDMIQLLSTESELKHLACLIQDGAYRAAINEISTLSKKEVWQPNDDQHSLLQRFWNYYAE